MVFKKTGDSIDFGALKIIILKQRLKQLIKRKRLCLFIIGKLSGIEIAEQMD
jgi:hypothetical protein